MRGKRKYESRGLAQTNKRIKSSRGNAKDNLSSSSSQPRHGEILSEARGQGNYEEGEEGKLGVLVEQDDIAALLQAQPLADHYTDTTITRCLSLYVINIDLSKNNLVCALPTPFHRQLFGVISDD